MKKAKRGQGIQAAQVGAALVIAATLFTIGRSILVARATTRMEPVQAPAHAKPESLAAEAPNVLGLSELHALDVALAERDPMGRGVPSLDGMTQEAEFERHPLTVGEAPASGGEHAGHGMSSAEMQYSAEPSLVSALGDFAIVRARNGVDHAVRVGDLVDGYVVRAIRADGVTLAAGAKEITLRPRGGQ
jgi:hypothetical protein